jgi:N-acetylneuraminic acid mutarotase
MEKSSDSIPNNNTKENGKSSAVTVKWNECAMKGTIPDARWAHTGVVCGYNIIIFAGYAGGSYVNDVWKLDTVDMKWNKCVVQGTPPSIRGAHSASLVENDIYVFGGYEGNTHMSDVHVLDAVTMKWTKLEVKPSFPSPRRGHTASVVGTNIYVFGGYNGISYYNDLFIFDSVTHDWSKWEPNGQKIPLARWLHAETVIGTDIYIFGGAAADSKLSDLWKFDTVAQTWTQLTPSGEQPGRHWGHSLSLLTINNRPHLVLFGGNDGSKYLNNLQLYDTVDNKWVEFAVKGSPASPRWLHSASIVNNRLFFFGGSAGTGHYLSDVHILSIENDTIQFQRPENLFFKSVINTKKAPGVEYTPTYDTSSINELESEYATALKVSKDEFTETISNGSKYHNELTIFLQKQAEKIDMLLRENLQLSMEQKVMKLKQEYNENLLLTEQNLRLSEANESLKTQNKALEDERKEMSDEKTNLADQVQKLKSENEQLKQDASRNQRLASLNSSSGLNASNNNINGNNGPLTPIDINNVDLNSLTLDDLRLQREFYEDALKKIDELKEKKLSQMTVEEAKKKLTEEQKCVICSTNARVLAFVNCGHMAVCESCGFNMTCCPICRTDGKTLKIFIA